MKFRNFLFDIDNSLGFKCTEKFLKATATTVSLKLAARVLWNQELMLLAMDYQYLLV